MKPWLSVLVLLFGLVPGSALAQATPAAAKPTPEEIVAEREKFMKEVQAAIAGREQEPAEAVFKNIQKFKGLPAGRLPVVMNMGFGRSLGVSCTHCHVPGAWEKDDKPTKQLAREMMGLVAKLNDELLPAIKDLDSTKPTINCTTCHRGEVKPALNLPAR
jgi:hypothetical protein